MIAFSIYLFNTVLTIYDRVVYPGESQDLFGSDPAAGGGSLGFDEPEEGERSQQVIDLSQQEGAAAAAAAGEAGSDAGDEFGGNTPPDGRYRVSPVL
jgi:hypothetical protein